MPPCVTRRRSCVTLLAHGRQSEVGQRVEIIRFSMLGAVDLRSSNDREFNAVLAQPKRLALLAYLAGATRRAFHSRDTLLALLWPDLDGEHARAALRQALYVLRGALGDNVLVTCGNGVIGLDHARFWCDVASFRQALDAGKQSEALALYGGEFLLGFHVSGAPEFERWLAGERACLAVHAATAAWALTESEERGGDLTSALEWARRLLSLDPENERALRRVVSLLDRLGDRMGALRIYREFVRRIAEDYAMDPAPETEALISSIRSPVRSSLPVEALGTVMS